MGLLLVEEKVFATVTQKTENCEIQRKSSVEVSFWNKSEQEEKSHQQYSCILCIMSHILLASKGFLRFLLFHGFLLPVWVRCSDVA